MKEEMLGILVCMLLIAGVLTSSANMEILSGSNKHVDVENTEITEEGQNPDKEDRSDVEDTIISKEDQNLDTTDHSRAGTTRTVTVRLKFFIRAGWTKNITNIVKEINKIFKVQEGKNNTQFTWNGTAITLGASNWTKSVRNLLRDLKNRRNCSQGINVVFSPNTYLPAGTTGRTRMIICSGVRNGPTSGIIMKDTCNETQMIKTLAHELLHALGLSHNQVKWRNPDTGVIESKNRTTGMGGNPRRFRQRSLGFPVPPHGYAHYDKDADCWVNNSANPADDEVFPNGGFDINGNCTFNDSDDVKNLLYGFSRWRDPDPTISDAQYEYIYRNANETPGSRFTRTGEAMEREQTSVTSDASSDVDGDVGFGAIDLTGSVGQIYWNLGVPILRLSMGTRDHILEHDPPDVYDLFYDFYIDEDDDTATGDPDAPLLGADYMASFQKTVDYTGAFLSEYLGSGWSYISELDWSYAELVNVTQGEEEADTFDGEDNIITLEIPANIIWMSWTGKMNVLATSFYDPEVDECPELHLSKERNYMPVLNLDFYEGEPGSPVGISGMDFSPNAEVILMFNGIEVATVLTDPNGDFFDVYFTVPFDLENGYYTVWAVDEFGKFHLRLFKITSVFMIDGYCFYEDFTDAYDVIVEITNTDTDQSWETYTGPTSNYFSLLLIPGEDIVAGDTLRFIAKDNTNYVGVTDHTLTQPEINAEIFSLDLILNGYYLDLIDFPMYPSETNDFFNYNQLCGPAVAQMNLNYMWWDTYPIPPIPLIFDDQGYLFNYSALGQPYMDSNAMLTTINDLDPPYNPYGYNFGIYHNSDFNEIIANICYWIDYPAGNEPNHPEHVPGAVPAYGDYSNWMSIRGIHTNHSVYGSSEPLTVHGFWVNDPYPSGIGENSYKMANEWNNTYYSKIDIPTDPFYDEYIAICEPPEGATNDITLTEVTEYWENQFPEPHGGQFLLQQVMDNLIVYAAKQGVRDRLMPYDPGFADIFEQTYAGRPLLIKNPLEDKHDYYAVPFNNMPTMRWIPRGSHTPPEEDITLVVVLVDAMNGQFKEASWVHDPVTYLEISESDALDIVFERLEDIGINPEELNVREIKTNLVYQDSSPYYPDWRVVISELDLVFFVSQDGTIA